MTETTNRTHPAHRSDSKAQVEERARVPFPACPARPSDFGPSGERALVPLVGDRTKWRKAAPWAMAAETSRWVNACTSVIQVVQFGGFFEFSAMYSRHTSIVPARVGGGSFRRGKNCIAKKEFAYRMRARRPTSAMPKPFLCCSLLLFHGGDVTCFDVMKLLAG